MTFVQLSLPTRLRPLERRALARRAMDIALAAAGLLCLGPVMALISLAILIDGGRPIFYSQMRLGQCGRPFRIFKFRKFDARSDRRGALVTISDDPRFTRLGRLLEKAKLDELPQLWNILKGEMSVVGPRPETLELSGCFTESQREILEHRPGIFGPNQYYFRNEKFFYPQGIDPEQFYREVLFPLKADIDAAYFAGRTLASDVGWVVRGVAVALGLIGPVMTLPDRERAAGPVGRIRSLPAGAGIGGTTRS
jgi:lipopolysaccharide/colanic/teichoic acid biosynthesis glycosyltransferase